MTKQIMVCGYDCRPGDRYCNGYCTGEAEDAPAATDQQKLESAADKAHRAVDEAMRAWYDYARMVDEQPERTRLFEVYENLRRARMV